MNWAVLLAQRTDHRRGCDSECQPVRVLLGQSSGAHIVGGAPVYKCKNWSVLLVSSDRPHRCKDNTRCKPYTRGQQSKEVTAQHAW